MTRLQVLILATVGSVWGAKKNKTPQSSAGFEYYPACECFLSKEDGNFYNRVSKGRYKRVQFEIISGSGGVLPIGFDQDATLERIIGPDGNFWFVNIEGFMERDYEIRTFAPTFSPTPPTSAPTPAPTTEPDNWSSTFRLGGGGDATVGFGGIKTRTSLAAYVGNMYTPEKQPTPAPALVQTPGTRYFTTQFGGGALVSRYGTVPSFQQNSVAIPQPQAASQPSSVFGAVSNPFARYITWPSSNGFSSSSSASSSTFASSPSVGGQTNLVARYGMAMPFRFGR